MISLDDLAVEIETDDDSYLLESIGNGYYRLPSLIVDYEQTYTISFAYGGKTIRAETYVPLQRPITISTSSIYLEQITGFGGPGGGGNAVDPIEISWDNSEGDYYFVVIQNLETDPEYINLLLLQLLAENEDIPRFSRITEPAITDFHGIDVRRELQQFGTHRAIVYRVNADYAALYESSGTSSVSITSPPTNIENGFGIFSGISGDTVLFNVEKL